MKEKRFTLKKIFGFLSLILGLVLVVGLFVFLYQKSQPKEIIYDLALVEEGSIESTTVATGKVSPRDEVLIKPQISGIVASVLKEAGDPVQNGEIIATIKVVPESSSLSAAESDLKLAHITLNLSKKEYNRQKELFERGVIAREEMEQSEADYNKALENVEKAKDNLEIIKTGVSKKTAQFSNTNIRSTITGTVLDVPVKVGNSVIQSNNFNEGTTIASVANMNDMIFVGNVDETEVGLVHVGIPVELSIGAIENKKFPAYLEYVSPKGVEENGAVLFEIKAAAHVTDTINIRAGYSANAKVLLANATNVLTIPEGCVSFSNDSAFVHILKDSVPSQIFEKKHVITGLSDGIKIEIKKGVNKGQKVRAGVRNENS